MKKLAQLTICASLLLSVPVALSSPEIAHAAQTISENTVADETTERTLTIWKYQISDLSQYGEQGDGLATTVDKAPLPGIKFSIQKVTANNGVSLVDPKTDTGYSADGAAVTVTTGFDGSAKHSFGVGTSADGIYLVTELEDDRGVEPKVAHPADPFFVSVPQTHRGTENSLIYDIEVQPKNILEVLLKPDKTIGEEKAYSIKAGVKFEWEARINIPNNMYQVPNKDIEIPPVFDENGDQVTAGISVEAGTPIYANYLTISDVLSKELSLDDLKVQVGESNEWTDLVFNEDYTVMIDDVDQENSPVTSNTKAEKEVSVSLTEKGMKKAVEGIVDASQLQVIYKTHTDKDFNGVIANAFELSYSTPGQQPIRLVTAEPTNKDNPDPVDTSYPKYYVGGFDILKTDEKSNTLAGAEFHLAESKEMANEQTFLATDGQSYELNATLPNNVTFLTATSSGDGSAEFNGLALDTASDIANIKRSYWVVETKAPKGYELLGEAKEVVVDLSSHNNGTPELTVVNRSKTNLPFTGGTGTTLLVSIALGTITIGVVAIVIDKKRRQA